MSIHIEDGYDPLLVSVSCTKCNWYDFVYRMAAGLYKECPNCDKNKKVQSKKEEVKK